MSFADLGVGGFGAAIDGMSQNAVGMAVKAMDNNEWIRSRLAKIVGKSAAQIAFEKRTRHVTTLDPDIAALRSITLRTKLDMQRSASWERENREQIENYQGILAKLWE